MDVGRGSPQLPHRRKMGPLGLVRAFVQRCQSDQRQSHTSLKSEIYAVVKRLEAILLVSVARIVEISRYGVKRGGSISVIY